LFVFLALKTNKNYFLEKYHGLWLSPKMKKTFFKYWYFWQHQFVFLLLLASLQVIFQSRLLNSVVLTLSLIGKFVGLNVKQWRLFYRPDFILALGDVRERFLIVLVGNMTLKLFVESNVVVIILLLLLNTGVSLFYFPLALIIYALLYGAALTNYFILQNSSFKIKKMFAAMNYLFAFSITTVTVYFVLYFIISSFIRIERNIEGSQVMANFFARTGQIIMRFVGFLSEHKLYIVLLCLSYIIIIFLINRITLKHTMHTHYLLQEDDKNRANNFRFVMFCQKIITRFGKLDDSIRLLVAKEFALFSFFYKYNFKEYFFVFIADRPLAWVLGIFFIVVKFNHPAGAFAFVVIVANMLVTDINANVGHKLIANMSFVTDYNTLLVANTSGFSLNKLIRAKLIFYYGIKSISYFFFFIIWNVMFILCGLPWWLIVLANILNLFIIAIFPKIYLTNNLLYSRMNYRDYEKYLDESELLDYGVATFYPLKVIDNIFLLLLVFIFIAGVILPVGHARMLIVVALFLLFVVMFIVRFIMAKTHNNVINSIAGGTYSADFAKIFK